MLHVGDLSLVVDNHGSLSHPEGRDDLLLEHLEGHPVGVTSLCEPCLLIHFCMTACCCRYTGCPRSLVHFCVGTH